MVPCKACGGVATWDSDLGSAVCTDCGTLVDAEQVTLASDLEPHEFGSGQRVHYSSSAPLKNVRTPGWSLAGQGKDARDARNKTAMHEFIGSLARSLGHTGLADRGKQIFDVAMTRGSLRWGRKAQLTAGAALALAFREAQRADPLRDIALLCKDSVTNVARAVTTTSALVGLASSSVDPSVHIPTLTLHLLALLQLSPPMAQETAVPAALKKALLSLQVHLRAVERTAMLLCALFGRLSTFASSSTHSTACAVFILALEAEARKPLPGTAVLASAFGARFGVTGSTVKARYCTACEVAVDWTAELPWAARYARDVPSRRQASRAKEGRRAVLAQSLKDAVELQEAIWLKKVEDAGKPVPSLDEGDGRDADGTSHHNLHRTASSVDVDSAPRARKRRKIAPHEADLASNFLLSQGLGRPSCSSRAAKRATSAGLAAPMRYCPPTDNFMLSHLLTADLSILSLSRPPSRLELLISTRGGGTADHVKDEELFEPGELDGLFRTTQEREQYMRTVDWLDYTPAYQMEGRGSGKGWGKKEVAPKGSQRVDMARLARLLGEGDDGSCRLDEKDDVGSAWDMDFLLAFDDAEIGKDVDPGVGLVDDYVDLSLGEDEEVEEWRPASPGGDGSNWLDC